MTIDGIDVSTYGARQHHVEFGHHGISNESQWIRSAILPHFSKNMIDFKSIGIDLIVKPLQSQSALEPRIAIYQNIGSILSTLLGPVDLELDGVPHKFTAILKDHKFSEVAMRKWHKLSLTFDGYEYGTEVTATGTGSVTITNPGNILSPVLLTITPSATTTNVRITGLCRNPLTGEDEPVVLDSVTSGKVITLDGANGLFTEGTGNAKTLKGDITIKTMPGILGGQKTISCTQSGASLSATVLPLYM